MAIVPDFCLINSKITFSSNQYLVWKLQEDIYLCSFSGEVYEFIQGQEHTYFYFTYLVLRFYNKSDTFRAMMGLSTHLLHALYF